MTHTKADNGTKIAGVARSNRCTTACKLGITPIGISSANVSFNKLTTKCYFQTMADTGPKMSMHEKSFYRRRITREHSSNLRAGYVHINEECLHKTGLRGRKQYFLLILIAVLILLTLLNIGVSKPHKSYLAAS